MVASHRGRRSDWGRGQNCTRTTPHASLIAALAEKAEKLSQTRRKAAKLNAGNPIEFEVGVP